MFCPNCGSENKTEQNYCRTCGLKLDGVTRAVAEQFPSAEYARLQRKKAIFDKLGVVSLSAAGLIGLAFLLFKAAYYKLILFGPEVLFWSSAIALISFLLLSVFFFNYSKFFMNFEKVNRRLDPADPPQTSVNTTKLIEDRTLEPAASVTDPTTELLGVRPIKDNK